MDAATKANLAANAAWMQLVDRDTNIEIANRLGVSRLLVPKLVATARSNSLADIQIRRPSGMDWELGEQLRTEFGLSEALVTPMPNLHAVARLAARYVCEILVEGGLLGIAWGRSAQAMVAELERMPEVPQTDVVQIIGGLPEPESAWHPTELLVRLTSVLGGSAAALLSPMIVADSATADGLREEKSIAHAFSAMNRIDVAVLGIGAWTTTGSRVRAELEPSDLDGTDDVVADVCGMLLNGDGETIHHDLSTRILSIDEETLRARPVRLGIAMGDGKVEAIRAALRSGLLSTLCTDSRTARLVLSAT